MAGKALKVAVLSGKGGTGKTLLSVNLAAVAPESVYLDCDVEEPNGHLFFKPEMQAEESVTVLIPEIDEKRCTGCRECVDFCAFHALAFVGSHPILFDEVCHSCGGCALLCPARAIQETEKVVGAISSGRSYNVVLHTGCLQIGEASGIPIIKRLLEKASNNGDHLVLIDCPPGSACATMESIPGADFCVLVAEPTVFGMHNLAMVHELVTLFEKPFGVVLNKCLESDNPSEAYCLEHHIPILGRIPFDAELGTLNSDGKIAVRENEQFRTIFGSLLERIGREARYEAASDSQR